MKILLGFLLACFAIGANAQTTSTSATLQFTAPTKRTDGVSITGPLSYAILAGPRGGTKTRLSTPANPSGTTLPAQAPGTCYQIVAIEGALESAPSNEACLNAAPNAATGLTVTVTIVVTAQ
jgi:hypothetical protein